MESLCCGMNNVVELVCEKLYSDVVFQNIVFPS